MGPVDDGHVMLVARRRCGWFVQVDYETRIVVSRALTLLRSAPCCSVGRLFAVEWQTLREELATEFSAAAVVRISFRVVVHDCFSFCEIWFSVDEKLF